MFQYASIFEKGRRILPRSVEPKGKKRRFHIQTGVTTKKGEFERRILPADAAEKGEDDGNMRGETDKRTRK